MNMYDVNQVLKNSTTNHAFFINKPTNKKNDEKCYLAVFSCNEQQAQAIIDGRQDLNSLKAKKSKKVSFAYATESELREACVDKGDYWIVTLYNNNEKINDALFLGYDSLYSDTAFQNRLKLYSYLSEISSHDGSIKIKKDPNLIPEKYQSCSVNISSSITSAVQNEDIDGC